MSPPHITARDFLRGFMNMLPTGRLWNKHPDGAMATSLAPLMSTWERLTSRAAAVISEAFPASTAELLVEWEESVGLPDPCQGEAPTLSTRRAQVVARFASNGGQSVPFIQDFAQKLGYTVTVEEYNTLRSGAARAGQPVMSDAAMFTFKVNAGSTSVHFFTADNSTADEPLMTYGSTVLDCELEAIKPAHTEVVVAYDA